MTEEPFSRDWNWMIGVCSKLNTQLDTKRFQMIWNLWNKCLQAECDKSTITNEFHLTDYEMNQSHSEANLEIELRCRQMTSISASRLCLINTKTLHCLYKKLMWILFNKKATLYTYSRNQNWVSSYWESWITFACNIQPVNTKDWIEWADFLKMRKLYSSKELNVGDKIVCDWITYIVDRMEHRDWLKREFYKSFIIESNWN